MLQTVSHGLDGEVLVIRKILKCRVVLPARRRVAEVLGVPWGQSGMWEVSWILLVRVQNGKLLRWHPMPHSIRIQWETVGALRWRIGSPWAERSLRLRPFLISAAPRSADDRGGKGPALLRSLKPLLWRWRQLRAVSLLFH